MKNPFWNKREHRLRAGWRISLGFVALFVLMQAGSALLPALIALGLWVSGKLPPEPSIEVLTDGVNQVLFSSIPLIILQGVLSAAALVLAIALAGRLFDRRRFADFGFHVNRRWWADFGFGLALGAVLMAFIFAAELAAGWVTVSGLYRYYSAVFWAPMVVGMFTFIGVGVYEEVITRGFLLRNLAEGFHFGRISARKALLIAYLGSSAVFGLLHLGNPNSSWISTINLIIAGLFLGLGFVLTGELAIPIGLHITWNYFQGYVFGFPVSGGVTGASLFQTQQGGPDLWTGGAFGPEAGLIGLIAILIGSVLTVAWVRWQHGRAGLDENLAIYTPVTPEPEQTAQANSRNDALE